MYSTHPSPPRPPLSLAPFVDECCNSMRIENDIFPARLFINRCATWLSTSKGAIFVEKKINFYCKIFIDPYYLYIPLPPPPKKKRERELFQPFILHSFTCVKEQEVEAYMTAGGEVSILRYIKEKAEYKSHHKSMCQVVRPPVLSDTILMRVFCS